MRKPVTPVPNLTCPRAPVPGGAQRLGTQRLHDLCISQPSTAASLGELVFTGTLLSAITGGVVGIITMTHPVGPGAAGEGGCGFLDPQACLSLGRTQHLSYVLGWPVQSLSQGCPKEGAPSELRRTSQQARISCGLGAKLGSGLGSKPEAAEPRGRLSLGCQVLVRVGLPVHHDPERVAVTSSLTREAAFKPRPGRAGWTF